MSSSSDSSDLVQVVQSDQKLQQALENLKEYVSLGSTPKKDGYLKLECSGNTPAALEKVRDEYRKEYLEKEIGDVVKRMVSRPGQIHYLHRKPLLIVFQSGGSNLAEIVGKNNCCILITVAVEIFDETTEGPHMVVEGSIEEKSTGRRETVKLEMKSTLIISGKCALWLPARSKAVCVVLRAGSQ